MIICTTSFFIRKLPWACNIFHYRKEDCFFSQSRFPPIIENPVQVFLKKNEMLSLLKTHQTSPNPTHFAEDSQHQQTGCNTSIIPYLFITEEPETPKNHGNIREMIMALCHQLIQKPSCCIFNFPHIKT